MQILVNTDKNINGDESHQDKFSAQIAKELARFRSHITRIEAHITDQNGKKKGTKDFICILEARLEGRQPIAVSDQEDTIEQAVSGALNKLKAALETILGRLQNH